MQRTATAIWHGDGKNGAGQLHTQSGVFQAQPYSFNTRFVSADGKAGTNPEELIAAAHAGCFAMALSFMLGSAGYIPEELNVNASVGLAQTEGHFVITGITLNLKARIPGIDKASFEHIAESTKSNCPVSKALAATPITLQTELLQA